LSTLFQFISGYIEIIISRFYYTYSSILLLMFALAGFTAPAFLESSEAKQTEHWKPDLDSLDSRIIDLCGKWVWLADGTPGGEIEIPSCYSDYNGDIVFTKAFQLPEDGYLFQHRILLGGVSYSCRVSVNGMFIDSHAGGDVSFEFIVPERFLNFGGKNYLEIIVNNNLSAKSSIPLKPQSWQPKNYGGIFREVYILESPRLLIEKFSWQVQEAKRGKEKLIINSLINNRELVRIDHDSLAAAEKLTLTGILYDEEGAQISKTTSAFELRKLESAEVELDLLVDAVKRWSPQDPYMYELELVLSHVDKVIHRKRQALGIRFIETAGSFLLLNDDTLQVRGISYSADHPDYGITLSRDIMEKDVENIKNLGANVILNMRGAPHPYLLELCDKIGMLVIEELPVWQIPPRLLGRGSYSQIAHDRISEMLSRDYLHPSLFAISLGSGINLSDDLSEKFLSELSPTREFDNQVLLTVGGFFAEEDAGDVIDLPVVDFLLLEPLSGKNPIRKNPVTGIPMVYSRISQPVEAGNQDGYENPYSEIHQAWKIREILESISSSSRSADAKEAVSGTIVHSYCDWQGDRPLFWNPENQSSYLCAIGVMSGQRIARIAYKELGSYYSGKQAPPLTRGEYKPASPNSYPLIGFGLLILLLIGYRQNNVFSNNLRRSFVHSYGFFVDIRDNRIYQFGQALFLWVLVSGASGLILSALLFHLRKSFFFDHLMSQLIVYDTSKEWLIRMAWSPLESVAQITLLIMALFIITSIGLRVLGLLFNARFSLTQAMTFLCWSSASLLLLIPLGIVFFRLLQIPVLFVPTTVIFAILLIWFVQRLIKSYRIAFEGTFVAVLILLMIIFLAVFGLLLAWYENSHSLFEYLDYYRRILWGT
jgi:hypothetical protein